MGAFELGGSVIEGELEAEKQDKAGKRGGDEASETPENIICQVSIAAKLGEMAETYGFGEGEDEVERWLMWSVEKLLKAITHHFKFASNNKTEEQGKGEGGEDKREGEGEREGSERGPSGPRSSKVRHKDGSLCPPGVTGGGVCAAGEGRVSEPCFFFSSFFSVLGGLEAFSFTHSSLFLAASRCLVHGSPQPLTSRLLCAAAYC